MPVQNPAPAMQQTPNQPTGKGYLAIVAGDSSDNTKKKFRELQGTLLCVGIMSHMAIQVILNIAVVTNTIPNTGITLPFISYGGTSVVFLLGEMGLALSVSRK